MAFMERHICGPQWGWVVDGPMGGSVIPGDVVPVPVAFLDSVVYRLGAPEFDQLAELLKDYHESGELYEIWIRYGYFGRYSADGYMDCTPWVFDCDAQILAEYLDDLYGDEEEDE